MKFITTNQVCENIFDAITDVRDTQLIKLSNQGDRMPVVVKTELSKNKTIVGVQFWTKEQVLSGVQENGDHTVSKFLTI